MILCRLASTEIGLSYFIKDEGIRGIDGVAAISPRVVLVMVTNLLQMESGIGVCWLQPQVNNF